MHVGACYSARAHRIQKYNQKNAVSKVIKSFGLDIQKFVQSCHSVEVFCQVVEDKIDILVCSVSSHGREIKFEFNYIRVTASEQWQYRGVH